MGQHYIATILLVGAGGFLGSILRFMVSLISYRWLPFAPFPYATLMVNITGCFLIGLFSALVETHQLFGPQARLFLFVGFLGGFTTFSTFGYETVSLACDVNSSKALLNIGLHLILGLTAVWAGQFIIR